VEVVHGLASVDDPVTVYRPSRLRPEHSGCIVPPVTVMERSPVHLESCTPGQYRAKWYKHWQVRTSTYHQQTQSLLLAIIGSQ
jgi:hypothetical protein